jgi:hypothetical protein
MSPFLGAKAQGVERCANLLTANLIGNEPGFLCRNPGPF